MRDIMATGYQAGANCKWFGCDGANNPKEADKLTSAGPATKLTSDQVQQGMQDRLAFVDDASGEYGSMLAFASTYADAVMHTRDQVISISDRLLPWEVSRTNPPEKTYFPGGSSGFSMYKPMYGLGELHFGEDVRAQESMEFVRQQIALEPHTRVCVRVRVRPRTRVLTAHPHGCFCSRVTDQPGVDEQRALLHRARPTLSPTQTPTIPPPPPPPARC